MTIWIGISGPPASGKSALAVNLLLSIKNGAAIIPFDKALKDLVYGVRLRLFDPEYGGISKSLQRYGNAVHYVYNFLVQNERSATVATISRASEKIVATVAHIEDQQKVLQVVREDIIREDVNSMFWVNVVKRQLPRYNVVISDDVRFLNDVSFLSLHLHIDVSCEKERYVNRLINTVGDISRKTLKSFYDRGLAEAANIRIPMSYDIVEVKRAIKRLRPSLVFDERVC